VNDIDTPADAAAPSPHPLARELAAFLAAQLTPHVLLVGYGNGRNVPALIHAGARITILEEDAERARSAAARFATDARVNVNRAAYHEPIPEATTFDGALCTHALLHGTPASIGAAVARICDRLHSGAPFFLTLGTKSDPRYGTGRAAGPDTYAPESGSERGVPHAYFDAAGARALLRGFTLERLEESSAAETAGSWAHTGAESATLRHWFVRASRVQ
jgi:SAM-dependent methyltransferase